MVSLEGIEKRLAANLRTISSSQFYTSTIDKLRDIPFKRIRCLALGSPTQEFQALYQLALLKLIAKEFSIPPENVSLYDPVFSADDEHLLVTIEQYVVEEKENSSPHCVSDTLYYMPHAPRSVTDNFLDIVKPVWVLGNDVRVTMGSLSKSKFLLQYPRLAKLVHLAELNVQLNSDVPTPLEDFTVVTGRRRRNRPKKNIYVEQDLDYNLVDVYFDNVTITRMESPASAAWNDSFSDLALNIIHRASSK